MHEQMLPFTQIGYSAFNSEAMLYCGKSPGILISILLVIFHAPPSFKYSTTSTQGF